MKLTRKNDEAVLSSVIGVILMVAITVILAAVIAAFVFGNPLIQKESPPYHNETITIVEKLWNGNPNSWGYVTTSTGEAYHVQNDLDDMRFQVNHTYNVKINTVDWSFPVIVNINYEIKP